MILNCKKQPVHSNGKIPVQTTAVSVLRDKFYTGQIIV